MNQPGRRAGRARAVCTVQKVMWPGPVTNGLACSVGCAEDKQHCSWPRQKLLPSSESTLSPPFQSGVVVPCRASSWAPLTPPRTVWDRVASRRMLSRLEMARAANYRCGPRNSVVHLDYAPLIQ